MEIYSTEEQQVEAIKKFWRDNGNAVIFGVVLGIGGLFGWKQFNAYQLEQAHAASDQYATIAKQLGQADNQILEKTQALTGEYSTSSYAVLANLVAAKQAIDANDFAKAQSLLEQAVAQSQTASIKGLAVYRLARVQVQQGQADAALETLKTEVSPAYKALIEELRGDILLSQGKRDEARTAFQAAVDAGGLEGNNVLQLKLDDLAVANPA